MIYERIAEKIKAGPELAQPTLFENSGFGLGDSAHKNKNLLIFRKLVGNLIDLMIYVYTVHRAMA